MKEIEHDQTYDSKSGGHKIKCAFRVKITKTTKGEKGVVHRNIIINRCRLKSNTCGWPDNSELTCSVPKYKLNKEIKEK